MKNAHSVILNQSGGNLEASVIASRDGIASATKIDDYVDGYAVKAVVNDNFGADDFVVRSVRYGSRRKLYVLFGEIPLSVARSLPNFDASEEANQKESFWEGDSIWLTDGAELVSLPNTVTIAAPKRIS
jgi:hypothetical protein